MSRMPQPSKPAVLRVAMASTFRARDGREKQPTFPSRPEQATLPAMETLPPRVLVVMGVSGSGKTTVGAMLAGRLRWEFVDGDDFHPAANVAKMHGGHPLTDEDRWPWLDGIARWIDAVCATAGHGVVACSALRRVYRDRLAGGRPDVALVYLQGDEKVIASRQGARHGHYMPASLIASQFATLEPPGDGERVIEVSVVPPAAEVVLAVAAQIVAP
jgi:gluconokinase